MLTVGLAGALFVNSTRAADISGAGSTFAAPIYTKWAGAYVGTGGGKVSYRGIGSTDGVRQIVCQSGRNHMSYVAMKR
ncbi:hypothetical protein LMG27177_01232 [Paraburkholderia fynbosensis]|uniref:Uncharacterized protein n=1 Tax=Paraburkholderia fynbosensis TaxID=1200993 RepID=A0A6J5FQJ9_9BURK|nr:hypothetical protein LMG27177_01232 [Paraburkholderia fynbosensis]